MSNIKIIRKYTKTMLDLAAKNIKTTRKTRKGTVQTSVVGASNTAYIVCKEYCVVAKDGALTVSAQNLQLQVGYFPEIIALMNSSGEGALLYKHKVDSANGKPVKAWYTTKFAVIPNTFVLSIVAN